jgi:hypothetical protein
MFLDVYERQEQNQNLKVTEFLDIISDVSHDFPFSRTQPLKLVDD